MLAICDANGGGHRGHLRRRVRRGRGGHQHGTARAATFDGPTILETSLRLGLRTESSSRFEKGLPRELPARAMSCACRLLVELAGRAWSRHPRRPRADRRPAAGDDAARVPRVLGIEVAPDESAAVLTRLGCDVVQALPDRLTVRVPFERGADLTREIDLIEEVARIHGLDAIPAEMPRVVGRGRRSPAQALVHRLERLAADLGLSEAVTYHLVPEADADALRLAAGDPRRRCARPPDERRDGRHAPLDAAGPASRGGP